MNWWLIVAGFAVHLVFFYSIFDIYFTSPLVHGMVPHTNRIAPPAKRIVLFVADGLRADKLYGNQGGGTSSRAPFMRSTHDSGGNQCRVVGEDFLTVTHWLLASLLPTFLHALPFNYDLHPMTVVRGSMLVSKSFDVTGIDIEWRMMTAAGAWGVSHTRVPTESRPGHVALIAGFYEDVSAVAKGWKENPVEFDSVFNESRYTWSWGSPDILPMFAKGASGDHVFTGMYPAETVDFAGSDSSKLDTWVFDAFKDLIFQARSNETLKTMLNEDKLVFFLHLLGIDTNGHSHKPNSEEYLANIRLVDEGMLAVFKMLEHFYNNDGQTAYVMTSDHGMSDWGSHGAGDPSETMTPLIAWGAGIRKPAFTREPFGDGSERAWNTGRIKRSDVNQADICALMAALIGVPFPVNSVGVLPVDYLGESEEFKAEGLFTNALQILAQYDVKMQQKKETTLSVFFTPFKLLTPDLEQKATHEIRQLISEGEFVEATEAAKKLIGLALEGLDYYHHYDRFFLGMSITLGFIGWTAYVVIQIVEKHTLITLPSSPHRLLYSPDSAASFWTSEKGIRVSFTMLGLLIVSLIYAQSLPWTHYLYTLIPVILWHKVIQRRSAFLSLWWYVKDQGLLLYSLMSCVVGMAGLEIIILTFFYRGLLSCGLVLIAVWPVFSSTAKEDKLSAVGWFVSSLLLAIFPLLPPVGREANYTYVYIAGIIGVVVAVYVIKELKIGDEKGQTWKVFPLVVAASQVLALVLSIFLVWSTSTNIGRKEGLPLSNQIVSWVVLATSFLYPILSPTHLYTRLFSIALAFLPTYLLLSMSHEGFFVLVMCFMLYFWMKVESTAARGKGDKLESLDFSRGVGILDSHRKLRLGDLRIAYIFIYLLITAFFGTGNIASINSFDPATVYCFLTVFDPFVMAGLLLWKIVIPFVLVSCTFSAIHLILNVPTQSLFLLVLLMSDIMGLHFFFLVRDDGSWLEIGTSISHYVMVMSMISFIILLLGLSHVFTKCRLGVGYKKHAL